MIIFNFPLNSERFDDEKIYNKRSSSKQWVHIQEICYIVRKISLGWGLMILQHFKMKIYNSFRELLQKRFWKNVLSISVLRLNKKPITTLIIIRKSITESYGNSGIYKIICNDCNLINVLRLKLKSYSNNLWTNYGKGESSSVAHRFF